MAQAGVQANGLHAIDAPRCRQRTGKGLAPPSVAKHKRRLQRVATICVGDWAGESGSSGDDRKQLLRYELANELEKRARAATIGCAYKCADILCSNQPSY